MLTRSVNAIYSYMEVTGLFERWVDGCPISYTSPDAVDVHGIWLLSILDGQRRYVHVAGLRGDEVAPQILGMDKVTSDMVIINEPLGESGHKASAPVLVAGRIISGKQQNSHRSNI